ncbi:Gfo/Idh/MocA family protein [Sedimentisphaera salicampi]|uniref:Gfo/Idh/MocA family protein n=1 Tax=Sedimentisphaera salicampi TaxID=1941349 RepID=UPI000B9C4D25|nr:Gfo/Idh/MocA family oxidoreductase [Sedimentisphaera salicampi]OXU15565.1 UDP-N-acetyl-2-amino-2-deoxy-D-glucuronate oxidase [Sedimentisphaera salicampi]
MKRFALVGVGGYVAPRHLKAIKDTGNELVAAVDKNDSVGILDSYFKSARFFTEFERFDRHIEKLRRKNQSVDYISICSPNYLHDAHCRFALRVGADAVCEKPLVLNPWNVDALRELEIESGRKINTILQLRLHPSIRELKKRIGNTPQNEVFDIDLTYITSRGPWYEVSWKGDEDKSGGIACNIGIHFFDMLIWIFGAVQKSVVHHFGKTMASGYLELEKARVRWFLSLSENDLPQGSLEQGKSTYRSITIDGEELEFSTGFTDLHTQSYEEILAGRGFSLSDVKPSIDIVSKIRNSEININEGKRHPALKGKFDG